MTPASRKYVDGLLAEAERAKTVKPITGADLLGRFVDQRSKRKVEMNGPKAVAGAVGLCGEFVCHTRTTSRDVAVALVQCGATVCPRCALWHFPADLSRDASVVKVCAACGGA